MFYYQMTGAIVVAGGVVGELGHVGGGGRWRYPARLQSCSGRILKCNHIKNIKMK